MTIRNLTFQHANVSGQPPAAALQLIVSHLDAGRRQLRSKTRCTASSAAPVQAFVSEPTLKPGMPGRGGPSGRHA